MARKPGTSSVGEFALFDVVYEDGSQRSNRRVPLTALGGLDGDEPAKSEIAKQDREIAEKSGRPALTIKTIKRAGAKYARRIRRRGIKRASRQRAKTCVGHPARPA